MNYFRIAIALVLFWTGSASWSQFVSIPPIESGFSYRSAPTVVLVRPSSSARAVLIAIPGGDGRVENGFRADMTAPPDDYEPPSSYGKFLFGLADPKRSGGFFNVVLFDSPYSMPMDTSTRGSADHLMRIESIVDYARNTYKLPVWLLGHSNGGVSVAEVLKRLKDRKKEDTVAGIIISASRDKAQFAGFPMNIPALFVAAERDACPHTPPSYTQGLAEKFRTFNNGKVDFTLVRGGSPEANPCHSGIHMYHQAHEELLRIVDSFASQHLK